MLFRQHFKFVHKFRRKNQTVFKCVFPRFTQNTLQHSSGTDQQIYIDYNRYIVNEIYSRSSSIFVVRKSNVYSAAACISLRTQSVLVIKINNG
jgi:hypothetical protein